MILVTGATGKCGRSLVEELRALNAPARALSRDPEKARTVGLDGVEIARGDLERPAEIEAALEGVDAIFLLSPQHPQQAVLQGNVVEAAKQAGVGRIVKVSGGDGVTGEDSPSWVGRQHWQTEQQIKEAGLEYTFLRPSYYMQNLLMLADPIRGGKLPIPLGDERLALIDTRDVGAVAAKVLTEDGRHHGQVYSVTGPESLSFDEVAERLGRVLGHEIQHVEAPLEAAVESLRAKGAPDWLQQHFREIMGLFRDGVGAEATNTVQEIAGRPPRTIDDFGRDHAEAFS